MPFSVEMGDNMFKIGYKFTKKKNPQKGIMSTSLGMISIVSVCLAVYFTYLNKGTALAQYGSVVLLSGIFAITGLVLGIMSCLEKDIYRLFPIIGIVLNSITLFMSGFILYVGVCGL